MIDRMIDRMIKKILVLVFLLLVIAIPFRIFAQEPATLSSVEVDLWPEFDRPTMLVIYRITLSPEVNLPEEMNLRIPATVGAPNAVAVKQPDGALISVPYEQQPDGDWSRLIFQATTPEVQVEFYDPALEKNGENRRFVYTWPGDYAVEALNIEVQRPTGASDMQIKPGMVSATEGGDGFTYYRMNVGSLRLGQEFQITVNYKKSTDELSASSMPVEPSAPLNDPNSGVATMTSALPWILGILGVLLIAGGGLWYWNSGKQKPGESRRTERGRRKPVAAPAPTSDASEQGRVYCHQCGKRASPGDRFCRTCGTELRLS